MMEARNPKPKKSKNAKRRAMDEEHGRQAQLWWMFGVGFLLAITALYQNSRPVLARAERLPAQLSPASADSDSHSEIE